MLTFLFKKERQLETLIYSYLENLGMTQKHFLKAIATCLNDGVCDDFSYLIEQTHKFESRADDLRIEVNEIMYSRTLFRPWWSCWPKALRFISIHLSGCRFRRLRRLLAPSWAWGWSKGSILSAGGP